MRENNSWRKAAVKKKEKHFGYRLFLAGCLALLLLGILFLILSQRINPDTIYLPGQESAAAGIIF